MAFLAPILVFGLVIFVHELGHFIARKAVGVYAARFSIGFGPAIFRFRRGETEYILAWLPLGGYVRMASRHDAETAFLEGGNEEATLKKEDEKGYDPEAMIPFGPKPVPEDRWFESKPLWARIIIMLAGVAMNVLLAIVAATVLVLRQGQYVVASAKIGAVRPFADAPALAQLQVGDSITAINGQHVATWNEVRRQMLSSSDQVRITTPRGDVTVPLGSGKASAEDVADAVVYFLSPVIDSVNPGDPAAKAGIQSGDSIVSVNGEPVRAWTDMVNKVGPSVGKPLTFVVSRRGTLNTIVVTPKAVVEKDQLTGQPQTVGKIGAAARNPAVHQGIPLMKAV